ncbi:MAG: DUF6263 family protein [Phycisphaerales bacterium JB037]
MSKLSIGVFAGVSLAFGVAQAEPVKLKWKFEKGQNLNYRMTMDQAQKISGGGLPGEIEMTQKTVTDMNYKVQSVAEDGTAQLVVTTTAVKFNMANPMMGMNIAYDSTAGDEPTMETAGVAAMVGTSYTVWVDESGKVSKVEGIDEMMAKVLENTDPMTAQMLEGMFNEETLTSQTEASFRVVPGEEVDTGDTWSVTTEQPMPSLGKLSIRSTYEYNGMGSEKGHDGAIIGFNATPSFQAEPGAPMRMSLNSGDVKGKVVFSPTLGQIVHMASKTSMNMGLSGQGMNMTMAMTINTTLELLD